MRIIGGRFGSRPLTAPRGMATRPTLDQTREALFNILQGRVTGARFLDLYAGSGAVALEALSRGAACAVLCDRDREANRVELKNIASLGYEGRTRVFRADWRQALETLRREGAVFDLVFLDPPYAMGDLRDVTEGLLPLLAEGALVVTEHQAGHPYVMGGALKQTDTRRWGYAGVTFYTRSENAPGEEREDGADLSVSGEL